MEMELALTFSWCGVVMVLGGWVAWSDWQTHTIPTGGLLVGLILLGGLQVLRGQVLSALTGGGLTLLVGWLLWRWTAGFGGGDVRYWTVLGVAVGPVGAFWLLAVAAGGALFWGLASGDWRRRGSHASIALGPWLAAASVVEALFRLFGFRLFA